MNVILEVIDMKLKYKNIIYIYSMPAARNGSNLWTTRIERKRERGKSEDRERKKREGGREEGSKDQRLY